MHMNFRFTGKMSDDKKNILSYLSTVEIFFEKNRIILAQFFDDVRADTNIEMKDLRRWDILEPLFDYYATHGKEALSNRTNQWSQIRLDFSKGGNFDRFFNLTETDIARLRTVADLVNGELLFANAEMVLSLAKDAFGQLISFLQDAEKIGLPLSLVASLCLYEMPQILDFYNFLRRHQMENKWKTIVSLLIDQRTAPTVKSILAKFSKDLKRPEAVLKKLEKLFNEYHFDEYSDLKAPLAKNDSFFPEVLSGLAVFDSELKSTFFGRRERSWEGNEITIWGNYNEPETHPFQKDDPRHPFQINDYAFYTHGLSPHTYSAVMQGKSREDIIENLLIQFEGLPIQERKENRLYESSEGVSRSLLESLPLAQLLKLQWLLNNLQDPEFRRNVRKIAEEDFKDNVSEAGGYMVPQSRRSDGIRSLHEPLELVTMPSKSRDDNENLLKIMGELQKKTVDPKKAVALKELQPMVIRAIDGEYVMPDFLLENRFGFAFPFHFHSNSSLDDALYAGPSGSLNTTQGDIGAAAMFGDSVVFTRLAPNKFDADFYGVYPVRNEQGFLEWR